MRILLFSGKGGVGKTSVAAATGVRLAEAGRRTLIISVDPAHSLSDAFDLGGALFHGGTAEPLHVANHLSIQEVNINHEFKHYWAAISTYITSLLRTTGLESVEAEEMAIFPGMEELSALMYVNQYRNSGEYEVIVLDCAPTAESLRFISLPTTLDWYMKHIFGFQRSVLKAVRPIANRVAPVELPPDSYFRNIQDLFKKIEGIDLILEDAAITSARLVTNPEKMVLRETQRAFVYFSLHGLTVDRIIVNRVIPSAVEDGFFANWRKAQQKTLAEIEHYFAPIPIRQVPMFSEEVFGYDRLRTFSQSLYEEHEDPAAVTRTSTPYSFAHESDHYEVHLDLPFAEKTEVSLFKKEDELVVEIGTIRRHVGLPTTMAALQPSKARFDGRKLVVEMR
ncbi:MAG TPA: TRC40/GET3/ArsA family transport-energizing ATPase [Bryobacteraceae bacterium]|nr:TRC40/GET3/ArsA family transport-energizing ATPase [Bryobacteraceae bacterium]